MRFVNNNDSHSDHGDFFFTLIVETQTRDMIMLVEIWKDNKDVDKKNDADSANSNKDKKNINGNDSNHYNHD